MIVNHFKSKGSGVDDGTGQGNANPDRVAQATALVTFANQFQANRGVTRTFLVGDFNAYSHEDPIDVLTGAGFSELHSTSDPDEESYNFDGQIGSLDHVLANGPAAADVTGVDVWPINGYESVYYEYSRFNYNVTNLYSPGPFRSSDHSPEIVGIDAAEPRHQGHPDPRHERLPRSDLARPGGRPLVPRCWPARSSSCGATTPTRCSRPLVTSSVPQPSSRSSPTTSRPSTRSTRPASTCRRSATTSSTRVSTT